jgi:integrase
VLTSTTISRTSWPPITRHGATWQPGDPAFLNARGKRWTRNAIAQYVIPPALEEANRERTKAGLPAIRDEVTPHTLRYTCIASLFAAGADQEYVADQVGHEDVTTTNRIYRYVLQRRRRGEIGRRRQLAMSESAAEVTHPAVSRSPEH